MLWRNGKVLLGERIVEQGSCWQFPGGHLEIDESVIECAARELEEEAGMTLQAPRLAQFTNRQTRYKDRHYVTLYITAEAGPGEAVVREPDKCRQWQWFDWQQLPEPLFQPIVDYLDHYGDLKQACGLDTPAGEQR